MSTPIDLNLTTVSAYSIWNGLEYMERSSPDSWTATLLNNGASEATRKLICVWSKHEDLLDHLLGENNYVSSGPFTTTYIVGATHPIYRTLFVDQVTVIPYTGVSSGESTFDYAELTVHYKSLPFDPANPTTVREDSIELSGMIVTIPRATLTAVSAGGGQVVHPTHDVNTFLPTVKITSTLLGVSTVPLGAIINCYNKLSSSDLSFNYGGSSYSITADQILYLGATSKRTVLSNGTSKYDVTHSFIVSPIHNKILDPTSTATDLITRFIIPPDGFQKYLTADFSTLGV